jgi:hypothetical protein
MSSLIICVKEKLEVGVMVREGGIIRERRHGYTRALVRPVNYYATRSSEQRKIAADHPSNSSLMLQITPAGRKSNWAWDVAMVQPSPLTFDLIRCYLTCFSHSHLVRHQAFGSDIEWRRNLLFHY